MIYRDRIKELRRVPAKDIHGAPFNWRSHPASQVTALVGSIEELGFFDPLDTRELPDGTLEMFDGHARQDLINARIGPNTLIPCIVTDFTEAEAKKANLLKDPLAAKAEVDSEKLAALLDDVDTDSEALSELMDELASQVASEATDEDDGAEVELKDLDVSPPPALAWVLIGIPTVRFGEIAAEVEAIAGKPGVILETTVTNG